MTDRWMVFKAMEPDEVAKSESWQCRTKQVQGLHPETLLRFEAEKRKNHSKTLKQICHPRIMSCLHKDIPSFQIQEAEAPA